MSLSKQSIEFNRNIISELEEINKPLIHNFGVFLFTYRRLNKDGTLLYLTTQENWIERSIQKNLLVSDEIVPKIIQTMEISKQNFLWSGNLKDPLYNSLYFSNIWNGITFYQNYESYIEIIAFASTRENDAASNFYINNLDLLIHFKGHFKEKANHIISSDGFKKLSVNVQEKIPIFMIREDEKKNHIDLLKKIKLSKYYLCGKYEHIYLTQREAEVLFYLTQGKTCKNIAKILELRMLENGEDSHSISVRTIEDYWNTIKSKFQTSDKSKIIDIFLESDIPSQISYFNRSFNK